MQSIREFLRHQYIGAIVIGLLAYQGIVQFFQVVTGPLTYFFFRLQTKHSWESPEPYEWGRSLPSLIQAVLAIGVALLLLWWLYGNRRRVSTEEEPQPEETEVVEPAE